MRRRTDPDLERLAMALARLLAAWWRRHGAETKKAAVLPETAAAEVRDDAARPSTEV